MDPSYPPVKQKMRIIAPKWNRIVGEEVDRLLEARHIREVLYPNWIANTFFVPKKKGEMEGLCGIYKP